MTVLTNKVVNKTRKPHQCFSCCRVFPTGSKMNYYAGIYDGDFSSSYACLTCVEIMNASENDEDGFPFGFVHEALHLNQTPEMLLEQIKSTLINPNP